MKLSAEHASRGKVLRINSTFPYSVVDDILLCKNFMAFLNPLPKQCHVFMIPGKKPFENIAGKGENAGNQHFLLFSQCFLHFPRSNFIFIISFILLSTNVWIWFSKKNCRLVKF